MNIDPNPAQRVRNPARDNLIATTACPECRAPVGDYCRRNDKTPSIRPCQARWKLAAAPKPDPKIAAENQALTKRHLNTVGAKRLPSIKPI